MNLQRYIHPVLWVIGFQVVAAVIGMTTSSNMSWYEGLQKSVLTPPDIAFPIVWTCLYIMLSLAGYFVWKRFKNLGLDKVFVLFWIQMFLNWGWSFVFFSFHLVALGFFWISALNIAMLAFIIVSWNKKRIASYLVIPTLLWGSFAAYLNYQIIALN